MRHELNDYTLEKTKDSITKRLKMKWDNFLVEKIETEDDNDLAF